MGRSYWPVAGVFAPALLYVAHWVAWLRRLQDLPISDYQREHGLVPAPDWLVPVLKDLPRRRITASEREAFRRDGAILVKGLVPNRSLMEYLREVLGDQKNQYHNNWHVNGIVHGLIKHGPFAELSATALDVPEVTIWNAQLEPRPSSRDRFWPLPTKPWYDGLYGDLRDQSVHEDTDYYYGDLHRSGHFVKPQASIFLAVTDIPHGFELLAGSHVANLKHGCRRHKDGSTDMSCFDRLERDCHGVAWWDLSAGDAVLFYGSTFHWSVLQENPRVALSIRYVPVDMMYTGFAVWPELMPYTNWKCGPIGGCPAYPIFYSNDSARIKDEPWPLWPKNVISSDLAMRFWDFVIEHDWRCGKIYGN